MKQKKKKRLIIFTITFAILFAFFWYQNKHLTITYYTYTNGKITSEFDGYRIVQISDLHNASFGQDNQRLLTKIEALNPDMIVITGDVVDSNRTNINTAVTFVQNAARLCPVYYVTGNHENWLSGADKEKLIKGFTDADAVILSNSVIVIANGIERFALIGLNDENLSDGTLDSLASTLDSDRFWLLLAHEPQYLDDYSRSKVDLVLTGHAHGGQFRLPFIGGVVAPDQGLFPEYTEGIHQSGNTTMVISRGLGNSIIPVRLFNDPEIVCVDLAAE